MVAAAVASMLVLPHLHINQDLGPTGAREELLLDETHSEPREQEHRHHHGSDFELMVHGPGNDLAQALVARVE